MSAPMRILNAMSQLLRRARVRQLASVGLAAVVLALTLTAVHALTRELSVAEVSAMIRAIPASSLWLALLATVVSHLALMGYDLSAVRWVSAKVSPASTALTAFTAFAIGNAIGFGVLTGGAVRMRMYSLQKVDPGRIAMIIAFCAGSFGIGVTLIGTFGLIFGAGQLSPILGTPAWLLHALGGVAVAFTVLLLWLSHRQLLLRLPWVPAFRLPPLPVMLTQLLLSAVDIAATGAVLWFLLPHDQLQFAPFIGLFAVAIVAGVISHVPAGIGVFEAIMLVAIGGTVPKDALAAALVMYRLIYFALPLIAAITLLSIVELRAGTGRGNNSFVSALRHALPQASAALTVLAGVWMLISGVTPATNAATVTLQTHVPLPLVEASHFLGSIIGVLLLICTKGLLHRLDGAWWSTTTLAVVAAVLALPKGVAIGELAVLILLLLSLISSRPAFDRRATLFSQTLSWSWLLGVAAFLAATLWLMFFVYRDVTYDHALWWQWAFDENAPRALRASLAAAITVCAAALALMLRRDAGDVIAPTADELQHAATIIGSQPVAPAALALMGDKSLLFSDNGTAFLMYGKQQRSWIALFDPIGPRSEHAELVWKFIELAHRHGGRPAFYQVSGSHLSLYVDAGMRIYKLGEYARVPLQNFSIAGGARAQLRQAVNRMEREGLEFAVLAPGDCWPLLHELHQVSKQWLDDHLTREKRFSMGAFNIDYLARFPIAVVRQHGRVVAFASLMVGNGQEITVDLMRHVADMPKGAMEFLFVRTMQWASTQGMASFGLGMAPMSGMVDHPLAPRWHRLGKLLFRHGERFYNFQGLRRFKDKFDPIWEPRYLAAPGGPAPLLVLTDTATLIAGGVRGVVSQ